jgi:hypothetical protein
MGCEMPMRILHKRAGTRVGIPAEAVGEIKENRFYYQRPVPFVMLCVCFGKFRRLGMWCVVAVCLILSSLWGRTKPVLKHAASAADSDYVSALRTANRFLQAWQNHDVEAGVLLLTDGAKHHTSADNLDAFFSTPENAYEIRGGKRLKRNRYCFSVVLFDSGAGRPRPHYAEMVVLKTGKDDWSIDSLPNR